ncbi:MAG: hypothetical protein ACKVS8_11050 [Phycisphaerales bacterium]
MTKRICQRCPLKQAPNDIDLDALLRRRRQVAVVWSIEDVQEECPELTDEQAWRVLKKCERYHNPSIGFSWDLIRLVANELFPERD